MLLDAEVCSPPAGYTAHGPSGRHYYKAVSSNVAQDVGAADCEVI